MSSIDALRSALADRYELLRELGRGGMATVYLARDVRHARQVAIKVLHPELAAVLGADRFLAEIKTTANLQHPHILPLFDSGSADGQLFYVMPFVEGETLRARLDRETQLPIADAVQLAREVADALQHAHDRGVIHRDIKPENILLQGGHALVADFGIALAVQQAGGQRMTQTGLSLGTPQYMAPEQAMGEKAVDARADIYALGAVTYEMLAGEPPFTGPTPQAIVARVLTEKPRVLSTLRDTVPAHIADTVQRAMQKLAADRPSSASEFSAALAGDSRWHSVSAPAPTTPAPRARLFTMPVITATAIAVIASVLAFVAWRRPRSDMDARPLRFALPAPDSTRLAQQSLAISPDGQRIVFGALKDGRGLLFTRALEDSIEHPVPSSDGGFMPFYSPDGTTLCFFVAARVMCANSSGAVRNVTELPSAQPAGAAWTSRGQIVVGNRTQKKGLWIVPAAGGNSRELIPLDTAHGETAQRWPLALADGDHVIFAGMRGPAPTNARLRVVTVSTREVRTLELRATYAVGVIDGQLLFVDAEGTLNAVPFDETRAVVTGTPIAVHDAITDVSALGFAAVAISRDGTLTYQAGVTSAELQLVGIDGTARALVAERKRFYTPKISPDGSRLAVSISAGRGRELWVFDLRSGTPTRLSNGGTADRPSWTPDGSRILFRRFDTDTQPRSRLLWLSADGSVAPSILQTAPNADVQEGAITPDGQRLVYRVDGRTFHRALSGDTTSTALSSTTLTNLGARLSPDGRWVAYATSASGKNQVVVQPFPSLEAIYTITADGGQTPVWSRDGRQIFYAWDDHLFAAQVETSPSFRVMSRRQLFVGTWDLGNANHANFDVAANDQSFVLLKPTDAEERTRVVYNWRTVLRARLAEVRP